MTGYNWSQSLGDGQYYGRIALDGRASIRPNAFSASARLDTRNMCGQPFPRWEDILVEAQAEVHNHTRSHNMKQHREQTTRYIKNTRKCMELSVVAEAV